MIKNLAYIICLLQLSLAGAQNHFDNFFISKTLRFDYIRTGNAHQSKIIFQTLKQEPHWGGSKKNLIDTFRYGEHLFEIYDSITNQLIYSRGYSSLFYEWQTTPEAKENDRCFFESITLPYPRNPVRLVIYLRNNKMLFDKIYEMHINTDKVFVNQEQPPACEVTKISYHGTPDVHLDIAFLAEGYTIDEKEKFLNDCQRFTGYLFNWAPYDSCKNLINTWAVFSASDESGTDIPCYDLWRNTVLNSGFCTFNSERYLTSPDVYTIRDLVSNVPYDQIYILVNTDKYGGGGIYNFYSFCTTDNELSEFVFNHEFGHAFAALGDEYYTSEVSYTNFFNPDVEPYQPNLTTLVDFSRKWADMIEDSIPVPTPAREPYLNKIGAFEGAGYVSKGVYRPTFNSSMQSKTNNNFGPVNQRAIIRMIEFIIGK